MIQTKTIAMALFIAIASIGAAGLIASSNMAYAQSTTSQTANDFGQGASAMGQAGTMGDHAKAGGAAGTPPFNSDGQPGRAGIGNVGQQVLGCPTKVKPGQLADILTGQTSGCP